MQSLSPKRPKLWFKMNTCLNKISHHYNQASPWLSNSNVVSVWEGGQHNPLAYQMTDMKAFDPKQYRVTAHPILIIHRQPHQQLHVLLHLAWQAVSFPPPDTRQRPLLLPSLRQAEIPAHFTQPLSAGDNTSQQDKSWQHWDVGMGCSQHWDESKFEGVGRVVLP